MHEPNVSQVLTQIKDTDRVLDIGGWARPFNRANYVLDIEAYETRGLFGSQGGERECFSKATWITRDLCDRTPYPFPDKYFDYVICSHTLEDIRDPIFVCSEINRIGRAGYIEVPSMMSELSIGVESRRYAGRQHHRWLIDIHDDEIVFVLKYHHMHFSWKHHIPKKQYQSSALEERIQFLCWKDRFKADEKLLVLSADIDQFLAAQVSRYYEYPAYVPQMEALKQRLKKTIIQLRKPDSVV